MTLIKPRKLRDLRAAAIVIAFAVTGLAPSTAEATPWRVAILGPADAPIVSRLQRNVTSMKMDPLNATVTVCSRDVVTRLMGELRVDSALCTDGDQTGIWVRDGERIVLKDAVVTQGPDDRSQELAAARAAMALQALPAKGATPAEPGSFTIVAAGPSATIEPSVAPTTSEPKDAPTPSPLRTTQPERITPRLVLGAGPAIAASRDGNSFAISAEAEIGVSRYVALIPWLQFIPANRTTDAPAGSASFRPTLFGFGFGIPILRPSSVVVPRIGGGYGILWMHVAPEKAASGSKMRSPEDLLAPVMYSTAAISVAIASNFRAVAEGMVGVSSHDMIVRIGGQSAAHWGVPVASLALRGEWVLP